MIFSNVFIDSINFYSLRHFFSMKNLIIRGPLYQQDKLRIIVIHLIFGNDSKSHEVRLTLIQTFKITKNLSILEIY